MPQTTTGGGFLYDFYGGNENLRPERGRSFETGLELRFFKNRVGLDVTYFNKSNFDQITTQRLSYGTGFIFGLLNGGEIRNSGLEAQLNITPIKAKNVQWDMNLNFTRLLNGSPPPELADLLSEVEPQTAAAEESPEAAPAVSMESQP